MFRGKESLNRIELSHLVQDLLNFGVLGSLQLWGGGRWVGGCLGASGGIGGIATCMHMHAYAHTCTHTHVYMYRNLQMAADMEASMFILFTTCLCMHMCMHTHVHACLHGTPPHTNTHPHPNPPTHHPPRGDPQNQ